jgi:hypothetical protein
LNAVTNPTGTGNGGGAIEFDDQGLVPKKQLVYNFSRALF